MTFLPFHSLCLSSFTTLFKAILWRLAIESLFGLEGQYFNCNIYQAQVGVLQCAGQMDSQS